MAALAEGTSNWIVRNSNPFSTSALAAALEKKKTLRRLGRRRQTLWRMVVVAKGLALVVHSGLRRMVPKSLLRYHFGKCSVHPIVPYRNPHCSIKSLMCPLECVGQMV